MKSEVTNQNYDTAKREGLLSGSLFGALAFAVACSGVDASVPAPAPVPAAETATVGDVPDSKAAADVAPVTPAAIASLTLQNGNVLAFYDFKRGVLVTETGLAGVTPALDAEQRAPHADQVVALWNSLAPDLPAPRALIDLQERLMNLSESDKLPSAGTRVAESSGLPAELPPIETPEGLLAYQDGCGNGCCDLAWLQTLSQCHSLNYPYEWVYFNRQSSVLNTSDDAILYRGLVCSAIGTSQYTVNIGGSGGTWPIAEGYYTTYWWGAGNSWLWGWDEQAVNSTVNSQANQHLHTYCGQIAWD